MDDKDLYAGLIRLHIFYHAAEEPIYGGGVMEELRRHGYELSPGTLYPMLHGLERKGYLRSRRAREGNRMRRFYMNKATRGNQHSAQVKRRSRSILANFLRNRHEYRTSSHACFRLRLL